MDVAGEVTMSVTNRNQAEKLLDLVVVKGNGPTLLGRDWLKHIQLDWKTIENISRETSVAAILDKYGEVFTSELGTMRQFEVTLPLKENTQPVFKKARPVVNSQRSDLKAELERLETQGVLTRSDWASPIVVIPKKDGRTRICGDYNNYVAQPRAGH